MEIKIKSNNRIMISGINGMGKSTLFKYLIKLFDERGIRVLVYDSEHEHHKLNSRYITVYQPHSPADIIEFDKISRRVWELGDIMFAIESIDFYTSPFKPLSPYFKRCLHWGRRRGIGLMMTTRRIASVHKDVCALCNHYFLFHIYLPNDIKYLKQFIGDYAYQLKELKPYHFIYWSNGVAREYEPIPLEEVD